ncbi:MAG TPA: DUF362 domain-containing protein, partial [Methanocella sp.]
MEPEDKSTVYVIRTNDRNAGVGRLMEEYPLAGLKGLGVALKANYNSADQFPASTRPGMLAAIVDRLKDRGVDSVVLAERSGMGDTAEVLRTTGVADLAQKIGLDLIVLDDLDNMACWDRQGNVKGFHWKNGFLFPKVFSEADAIVTTCCLKSHRFGGHFTLSLKNSVGLVAAVDPESGYGYMQELHSSPAQRKMIAEINTAYAPAFVIMDAIQGFSTGGPEQGRLIEPGLLLASADRVALDACGVAILRSYGTTPEVSRGDIFGQEQIARAVELGIGVTGPDQIEVKPLNDGARDMCRLIERQLQG